MGGVTACVHNEGGYSYCSSLNDKDDNNDKESEKSPMRVIGRGFGNLVIVVILVMEGVIRAALCGTALTLDGGAGKHEGSQPSPVTACAVTDLCIAL